LEIAALKKQIKTLYKEDAQNWSDYCIANHFNPVNAADTAQYVQWSELMGNAKEIREAVNTVAEKTLN
jgi:type IV secretory pathway TraG/TraD family ATPase VirD4